MSLRVRDISEEDLLTFVLDAAKRGGWFKCHFRPAQTAKGWRTPLQGDSGFPDVVLVHGELQRCVFAELKSRRGSLRPDQELWIDALKQVPGVEVYVWKPADMSEIKDVLLGHLALRTIGWS